MISIDAEIDGVRIAPLGVKVGNPAFDVTPAKYVTGIVTENGLAYPLFELSLKQADVMEPSESDQNPLQLACQSFSNRLKSAVDFQLLLEHSAQKICFRQNCLTKELRKNANSSI